MGTRETCSAPLSSTARSSKPGWITGVVPPSSERTSTCRPETCEGGRQQSQRSPGAASSRLSEAAAEARRARAESWTPLGAPVLPLVAITTATSPGTP